MDTPLFLVTYKAGDIYVETGDGTQYLTVTRHSLSMLQVAAIHYQQLLNKRCGCCGDYRPCFRVPSQAEIDLWQSVEV